MSATLIFTPKAVLTAQKNLKEFIRLCRDELTAFNPNLEWDDLFWASDIESVSQAQFTKLDVGIRRTVRPGDELDAQYIDFAKAYFRYQFADKPSISQKTSSFKAIRALEKAFITLEVNADITKLTAEVLDEADEIVRDHYSAGAAYHGGAHLAALARFVSEKGISENYLDWSSSLRRARDNNKTGIEGKRNREKKMPDDDELAALGEIFVSDPQLPAYKFATSLSAMMLCQPSRVGEMLRLPFNCDEIPSENLTYTDSEGKKNTGYGWRFRGMKGYDPEIKWIPKSMTSVGQEALRRVRDMSQPARDFAVMMEEVISSDNPKFPRHKYCPNVPDDQPLTLAETAQALGFISDSVKSTNSFLSYFFNKKAEDIDYTLDTLLPFVTKRLPKGFPWLDRTIGLKWSNALFVSFKNEFSQQKTTIFTELWKPSPGTFTDCITENLTRDKTTIFEVYGYNDHRAKPMSLVSHCFRHYLNTAAHKGEMSEENIAKWSSRSDIGQNVVYNHQSHEDRVIIMREINGDKKLMGADLDFEIRVPVTPEEFALIPQAPLHVTRFGFCEKNYALGPCLKHRDCSMCEEEVCIKGDLAALGRLKAFTNIHQRVVARDELSIQKGEFDSDDQSYLYHLMKLKQLQQKIVILESDDVPDGAQIRLKNPEDISPLERAVASRFRKGLGSKGVQIHEEMVDSVNEKNNTIHGLESDVQIVKLIGDFKLG